MARRSRQQAAEAARTPRADRSGHPRSGRRTRGGKIGRDARVSAAAKPARRVLVIGAGVSGAAAAWCLQRQRSQRTPPLSIHCWDAARGSGGRLATARISADQGQATANMGAQRLHYKSEDGPAGDLASQLCGAGILEPETVGSRKSTSSFVATGGSNEVCKWLLRSAGAELRFGTRVRSITSSNKPAWKVTAFGSKEDFYFDAIVFAGSVAEVFTTHGDMTALIKPYKQQLRAVGYTRQCCCAVVFPRFGPASTAIHCAFAQNRSIQGAIGSELHELVLQPSTAESSPYISVVAVSTVQFGRSIKGIRATHRPTAKDHEISKKIAQTLARCACSLIAEASGGAEGSSITADALYGTVIATKMNYWKFATVHNTPFQEADCLFFSKLSPLAIVGDYFLGHGGSVGTFGGCIRSASAAATGILDALALPSTPTICAPVQADKIRSCVATELNNHSPIISGHRVLIVGAGITGALTAHILKQKYAPLHVTVWDMARGAGGRMSTTRWGGRSEARANTGAQYISAAENGPASQLLSDALQAGVLQGPLPPEHVARHSRCFSETGKNDFFATQGTSAVVKYFLAASDKVQFQTRLQSLRKTDHGSWLAVPNCKGRTSVGVVADSSQPGWRGGLCRAHEEFDVVVLAMPPKDAARVTGDARTVVRSMQQQTKHVQWTARFSIALWFQPSDVAAAQKFALAACQAHQAGPDDGILDAVVMQPRQENTDVVSVVAQSSSTFWSSHSHVHAGGGRGGGRQSSGGASAGRPEQVTGQGRGVVQAKILGALRALSSPVPMPKPAHIKMLNWRTSQVKTPARLHTNGRACVLAPTEPSLVLAGDWCSESSFEGCAISAAAACAAAAAALGQAHLATAASPVHAESASSSTHAHSGHGGSNRNL